MAGGRQSPAGSGDRQPGGEWATYTTLRKRWPDGTEFTIRGAGALRGYQLTLTHPVGLKAHSHHRTVEDAKAHADDDGQLPRRELAVPGHGWAGGAVSDIEKRLADICEGYFQDLERQAYRPEGCSGDELAKVLVSKLGLTEERQHLRPFGQGDDQERRYVTQWEAV